MIRLSVDTSFDHVGLCLTREGNPVANYYSLCKRRNSKIIFQIIDEIFRNTNITLAEVDAYVINCGPGSYTGVRIGMAIVKTFAQVNKKPIVQVNSIELLANQIYHFKDPFYVVLNCNRGEIFYSKFKILDHQPSSQTPIKMSNIEIFFPLEIGNIKNVKVNANPKCIALAGKPLNIPKSNMNGKGEAYQS